MKIKQKIFSIFMVLIVILSMSTIAQAAAPDPEQKDELEAIIREAWLVGRFYEEIVDEVVIYHPENEQLFRDMCRCLATEMPNDRGGIGLFLCFLDIMDFSFLAESVFDYYAVDHFLASIWKNGAPLFEHWDYENNEWIAGEPNRLIRDGSGGWMIDPTVTPWGILGYISTELLRDYECIKRALVTPEFYPIFERIWPPEGGGGGGGSGSGSSIPDVPTPLNPGPFIEDHVAYIIGYPEGDVRPTNNITRAEVATVFYRLLKNSVRKENWTQVNSYPDVKSSNWFNNCVSVMSKMGIVNGYEDGTFRPNGAITRAEVATIAARFARTMNMVGKNDIEFSDISNHWANIDILYSAWVGWVEGYPDGTFRPNQPIRRAEFMTLVNRMMERVPQTSEDLLSAGMIKWVDNADTGAWYYVAVQEATNSHAHKFKEEFVPGLDFKYELWVEMFDPPDWVLLEKEWTEDGYLESARVNEDIPVR